MLSGKKTYLVGIGMIVFGIAGMITGNFDFNEGFQRVLEGLGFIGLRLGVAKTQ